MPLLARGPGEEEAGDQEAREGEERRHPQVAAHHPPEPGVERHDPGDGQPTQAVEARQVPEGPPARVVQTDEARHVPVGRYGPGRAAAAGARHGAGLRWLRAVWPCVDDVSVRVRGSVGPVAAVLRAGSGVGARRCGRGTPPGARPALRTVEEQRPHASFRRVSSDNTPTAITRSAVVTSR